MLVLGVALVLLRLALTSRRGASRRWASCRGAGRLAFTLRWLALGLALLLLVVSALVVGWGGQRSIGEEDQEKDNSKARSHVWREVDGEGAQRRERRGSESVVRGEAGGEED